MVTFRCEHRTNRRGRMIVLVVWLGLLLTCGALVWGLSRIDGAPLPLSEKCVATAGEESVTLTPEQARYATLISATAHSLGLGERGAVIALAGAWQESGLRNLDHGDLDSLGLFQQRPSQGWGTPEQIMDPHYATRTFLAHVVKLDNWRDGDVNDVIQEVQRSGVPDGYRKHVMRATTVAAALSGRYGHTGFTCLYRERPTPGVGKAELANDLEQAFGLPVTPNDHHALVIRSENPEQAWRIAYLAAANAKHTGLIMVRVENREWRPKATAVAEWKQTSGPDTGPDVTVTFD